MDFSTLFLRLVERVSRERGCPLPKSVLTDIENQMQLLKTEQWELRAELREIKDAM